MLLGLLSLKVTLSWALNTVVDVPLFQLELAAVSQRLLPLALFQVRLAGPTTLTDDEVDEIRDRRVVAQGESFAGRRRGEREVGQVDSADGAADEAVIVADGGVCRRK